MDNSNRIWILKNRLKATSFVLYQLMKSRIKAHTKDRSNSIIQLRSVIRILRTSNVDFSIWRKEMNKKYPDFFQTFNALCIELTGNSANENDVDILGELYKHFIHITYIYPEMYIENEKISLIRTTEYIKNSWDEFLSIHVPIDINIDGNRSVDSDSNTDSDSSNYRRKPRNKISVNV
jgi:hypothetical protein